MRYHFSAELLQQLKRCDLVKYVTARIPNISLRRSGNCYVGRCPHPDHNDEDPSFRIFYDATSKEYSWVCFGCHNGRKTEQMANHKINYGTDAIALVMWLSDYIGSPHVMSFQEAVLTLVDFFNLPMPAEIKARKMSAAEELNQILAESFCERFAGSKAEKYCKNRGFSDDILKKYCIGTDGIRLAIPLYERDGIVKGFIYRNLNGESPKYIHSSAKEGFIKSEYLFGLHHFNPSIRHMIITEGPLDVLAANQYGLFNVTACLGTALTEQHAILLHNLHIEKIYLAFDGDDAGRHATQRAIDILRRQNILCEVIMFPDNMDLFDFAMKYKQQALKMLRQYIIPAYEYEFHSAAEKYHAEKRRIQQEYLTELTKKALHIKNPQEYALFHQYVFSEFDINLETNYVRKTQTNMENPISTETNSAA